MTRWLWAGLALIAALGIPLLLGGRELLPRLASFPPLLLAGLFGLIVLCWCINTLRLRLLLGDLGRQMSWRRSLATVMSTEFAICATPGGSGGPLTLMALLARQGIRPARSSAVFAMDQLSDLAFFFCAVIGILGYALFHNLNRSLEGVLLGSGLIALVGFAGCLALLHLHRPALRVGARLLKRLGVERTTRWRWGRKTLHFIDAFTDTWRLPKQRLLKVFALTCLHWLLRYSVLYLVIKGLGADLDWAWAFLVQMVALSAGQFSLLPGGAGAAELTSAALLAPLVGKSTAAAILLWRAVTYYFYLVAGAPPFLLMVGRPLLNRLRQA